MTISQVRRQLRLFPAVGARRVQEALKQRGTSAKPGSSLLLLSPGLAERRATHQWLTRVGPLVRMRIPAVVPLQPGLQTLLEIGHTGKDPPAEKPPRQDAEEQLHLVQPGPMDRREVEHVLVALVCQKRPSLRPAAQLLLL